MSKGLEVRINLACKKRLSSTRISWVDEWKVGQRLGKVKVVRTFRAWGTTLMEVYWEAKVLS